MRTQLVDDLSLIDEEFTAFVHGTFTGLCDIDRRTCGGHSSLMTFCRLDVALMMDDMEQMQYFVHQVNRHLDERVYQTR